MSMDNVRDISEMSEAEVRELAEAYLDLLQSMTGALDECDTTYGFFWWSGRGFKITGHPPEDLVRRLRESDE
jgi:hypothetical protein